MVRALAGDSTITSFFPTVADFLAEAFRGRGDAFFRVAAAPLGRSAFFVASAMPYSRLFGALVGATVEEKAANPWLAGRRCQGPPVRRAAWRPVILAATYCQTDPYRNMTGPARKKMPLAWPE